MIIESETIAMDFLVTSTDLHFTNINKHLIYTLKVCNQKTALDNEYRHKNI